MWEYLNNAWFKWWRASTSKLTSESLWINEVAMLVAAGRAKWKLRSNSTVSQIRLPIVRNSLPVAAAGALMTTQKRSPRFRLVTMTHHRFFSISTPKVKVQKVPRGMASVWEVWILLRILVSIRIGAETNSKHMNLIFTPIKEPM